jgi:hypothetical protein
MTICAKCKHHVECGAITHLCAATKAPDGDVGIDPVTGRQMHPFYTYEECRDINNGACLLYEPRPIRWWQFWRRP